MLEKDATSHIMSGSFFFFLKIKDTFYIICDYVVIYRDKMDTANTIRVYSVLYTTSEGHYK